MRRPSKFRRSLTSGEEPPPVTSIGYTLTTFWGTTQSGFTEHRHRNRINRIRLYIAAHPAAHDVNAAAAKPPQRHKYLAK